ncbi:hypothetical protein FKM82_029632 [Ascaphus truei]
MQRRCTCSGLEGVFQRAPRGRKNVATAGLCCEVSFIEAWLKRGGEKDAPAPLTRFTQAWAFSKSNITRVQASDIPDVNRK